MKEIYYSHGYERFVHLGEYINYEPTFEEIKTELDTELFEKLLRSLWSNIEKEKRDKKTHMVDVA